MKNLVNDLKSGKVVRDTWFDVYYKVKGNELLHSTDEEYWEKSKYTLETIETRVNNYELV